MAIISRLTDIGIIAFSLVIGFLFFRLYSDLPKAERKRQMDELFSQLINFIIFIWIGKIVLNVSVFISDPLSVLAYPSDSIAFYFAFILIALVLLYKSFRKKLKVFPLVASFVPIFLISSFTYEFIQVVVYDHVYAYRYLFLLAILLGLYFILNERMKVTSLLVILVTVWSVGLIVIAWIQPYVTVFGFIIKPWFAGLVFFLSIGGLFNQIKKGDELI